MAVEDLAATVREQRSPRTLPLPACGELADVAAEVRAVRATLGGADEGRGVITGKVVDDVGRPVPDARVAVIDREGHQVYRAVVDADGTYRIATDRARVPHLFVHSAPGRRPAAVWRGTAAGRGGDGGWPVVLARRM